MLEYGCTTKTGAHHIPSRLTRRTASETRLALVVVYTLPTHLQPKHAHRQPAQRISLASQRASHASNVQWHPHPLGPDDARFTDPLDLAAVRPHPVPELGELEPHIAVFPAAAAAAAVGEVIVIAVRREGKAAACHLDVRAASREARTRRKEGEERDDQARLSGILPLAARALAS